MPKINYIQFQVDLFKIIYLDDRLNPRHISLLLALFQFWNKNHFSKFEVARSNVMKMAKIKSKTTYSKCINELHDWKYLEYFKSTNPFSQSKFNLEIATNKLKKASSTTVPNFDGSLVRPVPIFDATLVDSVPNFDPALVPYKNLNKLKLNKTRESKSKKLAIHFFLENNSNEKLANKFFNHYHAVGWKTGAGLEIINWKSLALKWIDEEKENGQRRRVQKMDRLNFNGDPDIKLGDIDRNVKKRYDEPL